MRVTHGAAGRLRRGLLWSAIPVFLVLSALVHEGYADPARFSQRAAGRLWLLGPTSRALNRTALDRIEEGAAILRDASLPPAERVAGYRARLDAAETLLLRSLRADPAQARALARLAAVQWELHPPTSAEEVRRHLRAIELAARMSPRDPGLHTILGRLMVRMGYTDQGCRYLRRAVELDRKEAAGAVQFLSQQLLTPEEILDALPPVPEILVALRKPYREQGRQRTYIALVAKRMPPAPPELLQAYGEACLEEHLPEQLIATLDRLGSYEDDESESLRRYLRSRALAAQKRFAEALQEARSALAYSPESIRCQENLGTRAVEAGRFDEAIEAYRKALRLVAVGGERPAQRAWLYREIGRAEEAKGDLVAAYDSYRQAVRLNPDEPIASRRIREMREAAGLPASPPAGKAPPR